MSADEVVDSDDVAYGLLAWAYNLQMGSVNTEETVIWLRETSKFLQNQANARRKNTALNENHSTKGTPMSKQNENSQPTPTEEAPLEQPRFDKRRIAKVAAISVAAVATVAIVVTKLKNRDSDEPVVELAEVLAPAGD